MTALESIPDDHVETVKEQILHIVPQRTSLVFRKLGIDLLEYGRYRLMAEPILTEKLPKELLDPTSG